jgi:hypothetical protein
MAKMWKGEAGKVRRRVLGGIDSRVRGNVGQSDLGRIWAGDTPIRSGHKDLREDTREPKDLWQARLYAAARGVTLEEALERRDRQLDMVREAGTPFIAGKGYTTA